MLNGELFEFCFQRSNKYEPIYVCTRLVTTMVIYKHLIAARIYKHRVLRTFIDLKDRVLFGVDGLVTIILHFLPGYEEKIFPQVELSCFDLNDTKSSNSFLHDPWLRECWQFNFSS